VWGETCRRAMGVSGIAAARCAAKRCICCSSSSCIPPPPLYFSLLFLCLSLHPLPFTLFVLTSRPTALTSSDSRSNTSDMFSHTTCPRCFYYPSSQTASPKSPHLLRHQSQAIHNSSICTSPIVRRTRKTARGLLSLEHHRLLLLSSLFTQTTLACELPLRLHVGK
jgi:hypothetical protein